MPSYIELDKQGSFPASSDVGKLILGFNTDGSLQATDNNGQSVGVVGAPYKVYTALLTQSGGDNTASINNGPLTIGVTYEITDYVAGDDFTNVGAPSNENGVKFVATGTDPTNYSQGSELFYNLGAPVVTVLENTIGNIWFTYVDIGRYYLNSAALFTGTIPTIVRPMGPSGGIAMDETWGAYGFTKGSSSEIQFETGIPPTGRIDDKLITQFIEIRMYN
jgi:hypothetical protein